MLQLLQMTDKWTKYLESGGQIDTIYSDLEKAFDKIPHRRLISKLHTYGLHDTIINWICDFLAARKYRVKVNNSWNDVTSGIPWGSVLGPLLFLIYINDLIECCGAYSEAFVFADDAKFYRHILSDDDNKILQYALDALQKWSEKWLLNLNINKCQVVTCGRSVDKSYKYTIRDCNNQIIPLKRVIQVLDLGVCFDEKFSFKEHIHAKINKACMMLGLIKRNFKYLTIPTFSLLYISMVRSHLDYCSSVWAPYRKGDVEALEKVQKTATKILPGLKNLPYSKRLKICKIPTLHYRRIRGDMIETYKIVSEKYQPDVAPTLYKSSVRVTRGNDMRLEKSRVKYDLQKFSFSNRVVNIWTSLPD